MQRRNRLQAGQWWLAVCLACLAGCESATEGDADSEGETEATATDQATERVQAEAGVGRRGRSLDDNKMPHAVAAATYFQTRERLVFEVSIPQAMNLWQATNGRYPRDMEEFQREILDANNIELPELPEGHRYVYDAENAQLMVERPARS